MPTSMKVVDSEWMNDLHAVRLAVVDAYEYESCRQWMNEWPTRSPAVVDAYEYESCRQWRCRRDGRTWKKPRHLEQQQICKYSREVRRQACDDEPNEI